MLDFESARADDLALGVKAIVSGDVDCFGFFAPEIFQDENPSILKMGSSK